MITGNVVVDAIHRESAGNVYVGSDLIIPSLQEWTTAAKENNTAVWAQISHAGRQTSRFLTRRPLAPSEIQLKKLFLFGKPRAMSASDIEEVIRRFVDVARICKEGGFDGIQLHSAHGYLLHQFLSPITNRRTDQWGGSLDNRCRLLMTIIDQTRAVVGSTFPISVKLNSSDFQKGGFTEEESLAVVKKLEGKIDLLEISGGTYEKLVFFEMHKDLDKVRESTMRREAFFIEFSKKVRAVSQVPLLVTGGFRSHQFCNNVLEKKELDFIGMARPFITNIDEISDFINGKVDKLDNLIIGTGFKSLDDAAEGGYYARQLIRLSEGRPLDTKLRPFKSAIFFTLHELRKARASKKFYS